MMRVHKFRKKGVSLVELILSIAVLSLLSIYVIKMFIISDQLNQEAEALDQSVVLASQIFEQVEASKTFEAFLKTPLLDQAVVVEKDEITEMHLYFDDMWQKVDENGSYLYQVLLTRERVPALAYQIDYYYLTVNAYENLKWEPIYELEMQKYD